MLDFNVYLLMLHVFIKVYFANFLSRGCYAAQTPSGQIAGACVSPLSCFWAQTAAWFQWDGGGFQAFLPIFTRPRCSAWSLNVNSAPQCRVEVWG